LEVWIKKAYEGDLAVSVGLFFLNSSFNPPKVHMRRRRAPILGLEVEM
jgi:hypothetical protein